MIKIALAALIFNSIALASIAAVVVLVLNDKTAWAWGPMIVLALTSAVGPRTRRGDE